MPSLQFKGKALVQNHHLVVPFSELEPVKTKGMTKSPSLHDNLIIEGDNLRALKALLPTYHGKVKCVYIDPPYNTGNVKKEGWRYNDNVDSPMIRDWVGKVVSSEDLTRHDKWLCMMMPRLRLLREFLTDDGVIIVSIDDNEVHHLRALIDEIFSEENFISQLVWEKVRNNDAKLFSVGHEYMLVYARSLTRLRELKTIWRETRPGAQELWDAYVEFRKECGDDYKRGEAMLRRWFDDLPKDHPSKALSRFRHIDKWGPWRDRDISWPGGDGPRYEVINPSTGQACEIPEAGWRYSTVETMQQMIEQGFVEFREDKPTKPPIRKAHLRPVAEELLENGDVPEVDDEDSDAEELGLQVFGSVIRKQSQVTVKQFRQIMGKIKFNNPKDPEILSRIFRYVTDDDHNAIFLDAFAGSGTTGHAVLSLNKTDSGTRRFVMIESETEYIDKVTCERVRRVIRGVPNTKDEALRAGLGGSFSYFRLGRELRKQAILDGKNLPSYESLAGYVFFTATGEEFLADRTQRADWFIGESREYDVFLIYEQEVEKLKNLALNLELARKLPSISGKKKLVFAPTKYLDQEFLDRLKIKFCQLPFEIYQNAERA